VNSTTARKNEQSKTYLIVGLGNPGSEFQKTRHNIGFMAVDKICQYYQIPWSQHIKMDGIFSGTFCDFNQRNK
jgi:peptidyl-tRNA hydrolase